MLSFALLFAIATVSSAFPQPIQSTGVSELSSLINGADCGFYAALNELYQCGPKSHLMQYSLKYCQLLVSARDTFENTQYQDNARQCLQQKLVDQLQKASTGAVTCDSFKKLDLDSHGSCLAVSFKQLSASDVEKFIAVFKDTTVNYAQLCKMANGFAGHWSQIVKGDLMSFVKKQLKVVFPEGDTSACSIKEKEVLEDIEDIISEVTKIVDTVKGVKDDIVLIIEKAKAIRDDFKAIQDTVKGIKNGTIPELDGVKAILQRTKSIVNSAQTIVDTIKKLVKAKSGQSGEVVDKINRVLDDLISIIDQVESLKGEIYKVIDNVDAIMDIVDNIRDGKTDIFDGLIDIVNQVDSGVDNIYSIMNTTYTIKETIVDLFDTVIKDVEGAVGDLVEGAGEKVDEIVGGATDAIDGATGAIGGVLGGFGK